MLRAARRGRGRGGLLVAALSLLVPTLRFAPAAATHGSPSSTTGQCQPITQYVHGTTCGTRKVIAILVDWSGESLSTTPGQVSSYLFGADPRALSSWYQSVSHGDFSIAGDVTPIYTIAKPDTCDRSTITTEAEDKARANGYKLDSYETEIVDFPGGHTGSLCGALAQGDVAHRHVLLTDFLGNLKDAYARYVTGMEVTHTMGLPHANALECGTEVIGSGCLGNSGANGGAPPPQGCSIDPPPIDPSGQTNCEYGNPWDVMGSDESGWVYDHYDPGYAPGAPTNGSFDAIELANLGWSAGRTQDVTDPGIYKLSPLEQSNPAYPQALVLHDDQGREFDVEFRQPVGVDGYLQCWPLATDGVLVNMRDTLSGSPGLGQSLLLDMTPDSDAAADSHSGDEFHGGCIPPPVCERGSGDYLTYTHTYCDLLDSALHVGERWIYPSFGVVTVLRVTPQAATVEVQNGDAVLVDPALRDFGQVAPGSTSAAESFSLENLTGQTVHVSSVVVGDASPFAITQDGCSGQGLAPGATCEVDVEAQPPGGTQLGTTLRDKLIFHDDWAPLPDESARLSVYVTDVSPTGAWFTEPTPGSETGEEQPEGIACVADGSTGRCWAVGLKYNGTKPNFGTVYTNKGGDRWTRQTVPAGVGQLNYASCVSPSRCWATGYNRATPLGPAIIATTDGGKTWVRQHPPPGITYVGQISCVSAARCWIVANYGGDLIKTVDGGATWHVEHVPGGMGSPAVRDVSFVNADVGKAVGGIYPGCGGTWCAEVIWGTTDGGRTWRIERKRHLPGLQAISCVDARHCWAAASPEAVVATFDGGSTWAQQGLPSVSGASLTDISCTGAMPGVRCWASGLTTALSLKGVLLRTVNGGRGWTRQQLPKGVTNIQQVQAVGPLLGWAVAPNEDHNDWIIVTRTGGLAP